MARLSKELNMNNLNILVKDEYMFDAVCKLFKDNNFKVSFGDDFYRNHIGNHGYLYVTVHAIRRELGWNPEPFDFNGAKSAVYSASTDWDILVTYAKESILMKLGDYEVKFLNNLCIQVGCVEVTKSQIEEILKRLNNV